MDILKPFELVWSLIVANIVLVLIIVGLVFYLFRIRRKTYLFYHKNIKRPINRFNLALKKSMNATKIPETEEGLATYHMSAFNYSDQSEDPYANTTLMAIEKQKKFCQKKIKDIRTRIYDYFVYTNGRIKPEDLFELELYKRELLRIENLTK